MIRRFGVFLARGKEKRREKKLVGVVGNGGRISWDFGMEEGEWRRTLKEEEEEEEMGGG